MERSRVRGEQRPVFGAANRDEALEVQSEYAKSVFEDYSAQVTKLGQLYADLATDAFKPFEAPMAKTSHSK